MAGSLLRTYYYDTNPFDPSFPQYSAGRLTAIQYANSNATGQFTDMFRYTVAGQIEKKRLRWGYAVKLGFGQTVNRTLDFEDFHTYDNEGKMLSVMYPSLKNFDAFGRQITSQGPQYTYGFDSMQRPSSLADYNGATVVNGIMYGAANELKNITYFGNYETRSYNSMLQMTDLKIGTAPGSGAYLNMTYTFSATQNDGRITKQKDNLSGEEVQYQYDSLNRMISAATTAASDGAGVPAWGQGYGFDGFGNLTSKSVTKGSGPTLSVNVDGATNRVAQQIYDANGNLTSLPNGGTAIYDAENRMINDGSAQFGYDAANRRVWKWAGSQDFYGNPTGFKILFYGIDGQLMGEYNAGASVNGPLSQIVTTSAALRVYFGGKLIGRGTHDFNNGVQVNAVRQDRLGSVEKAFPYGEPKSGVTVDMYATYTRDTSSNLDYAMNRYYTSQWGRFTTPDPYVASGGAANPGSWNRYAYVEGDPVNATDPWGLETCREVPNGPPACFPEPSIPSSPQGPKAPPHPTVEEYDDIHGKKSKAERDWEALAQDCQNGLSAAMQVKTGTNDTVAARLRLGALSRALDYKATLQAAASTHNIDWRMLAAIGIRETGFSNKSQADGAGRGVFQIDVGQNPSVTAKQAADIAWAADWVAARLASNMKTLSANFPALTPDQLLQATAASYNLGIGGISGNPATIDVGSTRNNYGSSVVGMIKCF